MVAAVTRDVLVTGTIDGDAVGGRRLARYRRDRRRLGPGAVGERRGAWHASVVTCSPVPVGSVVAEDGSVGGDIITAAFSLDMAGHVGRGILGRVWRARSRARSDGNIEIDGRRLELADGARVGGDVRYRSPFGSGRRRRRRGGGDGWAEEQRPCGARPLGSRGDLGLGSPRLSGRRAAHPPGGPGVERPCADSVRHRPFRSVLFGLIALLSVAALLAAVALVLFLSAPDLAVAIVAVSLPFTLGAVGILGLGLALGPVPVATAVGGMVARRASPYTHFLVAAPLVVALPFVPWSDGRSSPVVAITGLGAWVRRIRPRRRSRPVEMAQP